MGLLDVWNTLIGLDPRYSGVSGAADNWDEWVRDNILTKEMMLNAGIFSAIAGGMYGTYHGVRAYAIKRGEILATKDQSMDQSNEEGD